MRIGLKVFLLFAVAWVPAHAVAKEMPGQSEMLDRVIALTGPCNQRQLLLGTYDDIAATRPALPSTTHRGQKILARMIWQNHMLYVFAGVAEQWDLANGFMKGTVLLGQIRSGEREHEAGVREFAAWQGDIEVLRAKSVGSNRDACPAGASPATLKLRADLGRWILRQARANGSRGLDQ